MAEAKNNIVRSALLFIVCISLVFSTLLSAFGASSDGTYTYDDSSYITSVDKTLSGTVTVSAKARGIRAGAFKNKTLGIIGVLTTVNVSSITSVVIPSSVTVIESGAFSSDCKSLKSVTIQNAKSKVRIAGGAFPSGVTVTYTVEDTTAPTAAPTVPPTEAPSPTTEKTTTTKTTKPTTTQPTEEETTTQTTGSTKWDFARFYDEYSANMSTSAYTQENVAAQSQETSDHTARYLSIAAVSSVSLIAVVLTFFKFKR